MEASQMAIVKRIEQVLDTAYREMMDLIGDLVDINKKLLPLQPVAKDAEAPEKAAASGWFEEMLQKLTFLRGKIQVTRLEESERLKRAVAAGEVKRAEEGSTLRIP